MARPNRIYHTWDKWECYPAGFYATKPPGKMTRDEAEEKYREFLSDIPEFRRVLAKILIEWKHSLEHYLTNDTMNRIAYMGQAAMAYKYGIPSSCRGGYHRLSSEEQVAADNAALDTINEWMVTHGWDTYTLDTIKSRTEANLY